MIRAVFLTGATGFVGQAVARRLADGPWTVRALARKPGALPGGVEAVTGDLADPAAYQAALAGVDAVIHLAAATGTAPEPVLRAVNVEGTRKLAEAAHAAGVPRFLHVSTIAAGYADKRGYPYAVTKAEAEAVVLQSGLAATIVRPTIVIGEGSPIGSKLAKIAGLPVVPLPRPARPVRTQPIDVADVAEAIALILETDRFRNEVLDLGGPEAFTFDAFMARLGETTRGRAPKVIPIPLPPLKLALGLLDATVLRGKAIVSGQAAAFGSDTTASENGLMAALRPRMTALAETLAATAKPPAVPAPLAHEAAIFARALIGAEPSPAAVQHYIRACRAHGLADDAAFSPFDRKTLKLARKGPAAVRRADAFCALAHRRGALRRKLIAMAAILESAAPTDQAFEPGPAKGPVAAVLTLAGLGFGFVVAFVLGALALIPARLTAGRAA